jgi:hypothetical protein
VTIRDPVDVRWLGVPRARRDRDFRHSYTFKPLRNGSKCICIDAADVDADGFGVQKHRANDPWGAWKLHRLGAPGL